MKDFIFIIGTSGVGKTTLGKGLFEHYNGAFVEQNMIPEFGIPENVDEGVFEEMIYRSSIIRWKIGKMDLWIMNCKRNTQIK